MDLKTWTVRMLTPPVAPMVYLMMLVSAFIGFCFFTGILVAANESVLYATNILVDKTIWGVILCSSGLIAELGFVIDKSILIMIGSMGGFLMWTFASLGLLMAGHVYVFITLSLFQLLFQIYVYLAESLDILRTDATRKNS